MGGTARGIPTPNRIWKEANSLPSGVKPFVNKKTNKQKKQVREQKSKVNLNQWVSTRVMDFASCPHFRGIWQCLTTSKEWNGLTIIWSKWKDRLVSHGGPGKGCSGRQAGPSLVGPGREAKLCYEAGYQQWTHVSHKCRQMLACLETTKIVQ